MQINSFKSTRNNRKLNENQKSEHFLGVFEEKILTSDLSSETKKRPSFVFRETEGEAAMLQE